MDEEKKLPSLFNPSCTGSVILVNLFAFMDGEDPARKRVRCNPGGKAPPDGHTAGSAAAPLAMSAAFREGSQRIAATDGGAVNSDALNLMVVAIVNARAKP